MGQSQLRFIFEILNVILHLIEFIYFVLLIIHFLIKGEGGGDRKEKIYILCGLDLLVS